jgi:hypothetical protein
MCCIRKRNIVLDDPLLSDFIRRFYGYGDYEGRTWLVGMEEGGGGSCEEIGARLQAWDQRGRRELEDVAAYHTAFGAPQLFSEKPTYQRTWHKLIRILLATEGVAPVTKSDVYAYQRFRLGRPDSDHCLLELLPLPSPSTAHWLYRDCSALPYLSERERYRTTVAPFRISHLQHQIGSYRPAAVVFYSFGYRREWEKVAGVPLRDNTDLGCAVGRSDDTIYVITRHPAAKGVTSAYFDNIGRALRSW